MEITKETALRLWNKQFGRKIKVADYSGRTIDKAAYNSRNSKFGWNIDHILPLSQGGKTADYNLICCHILTNDEKADKFPCFTANGKHFEIRRQQNHYEIFHKDAGKSINFFDAGQGIDFLENNNDIQEYSFIGYVKIRLTSPENITKRFVIEFKNFLINLFNSSAVFINKSPFYTENCICDYTFTVINFDVPKKEDTQNLLDHCILLNTYGQYYYNPLYNCTLRIYCGMKTYKTEEEFSMEEITKYILSRNCASLDLNSKYYLAIHGLIKKNTDADDALAENEYIRNSYLSVPDNGEGYFPYDKTFPNVKKILEKNL